MAVTGGEANAVRNQIVHRPPERIARFGKSMLPPERVKVLVLHLRGFSMLLRML